VTWEQLWNPKLGRPLLVARLCSFVTLSVVAGGCLGSSSQHAELTSSQALAQAKADGFAKIYHHVQPASWDCANGYPQLGTPEPTGGYRSYMKPRFELDMRDPHIRGSQGVVVIVLPSDAGAASCAAAEINELLHPFTVIKHPAKQIDDATVVVSPHPPNAPGETYAKATGDYEISLARGRVLALGNASTQPEAATLESDMSKLASQIAGQ
jgi:hypothetical protein